MAFLLLSIAALSLQACKKGCTDSAALNYNYKAKMQDGSCVYCDSTFISMDTTANVLMYDENFSSAHLGQHILNGRIITKVVSYAGNGCRLYGHDNSGCQTRYYSAILQNVTSYTLTVSDILDVTQNSTFQIRSYPTPTITIAPLGVVGFRIQSNDCLPEGIYTPRLLDAQITYN
jgi:hypothetical protein